VSVIAGDETAKSVIRFGTDKVMLFGNFDLSNVTINVMMD